MNRLGRPQVLLIAGLLTGTAATALVQFVLIGLIGVLLAPIALGLLIWAGIRVRDLAVPKSRAFGGLLLFLTGIVILTCAAGFVSSFGYSIVFHRDHPSEALPSLLAWLLLALSGIAASLAISHGLALRGQWPTARIVFWAGASFAVLPVGLAVFFVLALAWPIST